MSAGAQYSYDPYQAHYQAQQTQSPQAQQQQFATQQVVLMPQGMQGMPMVQQGCYMYVPTYMQMPHQTMLAPVMPPGAPSSWHPNAGAADFRPGVMAEAASSQSLAAPTQRSQDGSLEEHSHAAETSAVNAKEEEEVEMLEDGTPAPPPGPAPSPPGPDSPATAAATADSQWSGFNPAAAAWPQTGPALQAAWAAQPGWGHDAWTGAMGMTAAPGGWGMPMQWGQPIRTSLSSDSVAFFPMGHPNATPVAGLGLAPPPPAGMPTVSPPEPPVLEEAQSELAADSRKLVSPELQWVCVKDASSLCALNLEAPRQDVITAVAPPSKKEHVERPQTPDSTASQVETTTGSGARTPDSSPCPAQLEAAIAATQDFALTEQGKESGSDSPDGTASNTPCKPTCEFKMMPSFTRSGSDLGSDADSDMPEFYEIDDMLRIKALCMGPVPPELSGFGISKAANSNDKRSLRPGSRGGASLRETMFGTAALSVRTDSGGKSRRSPASPPKMPQASPTAYKITTPKSREEKLEREVRSLLNKIAPENLDTIAWKMSEIELESACEMTLVIKIILGKAVDEPHYSATYGDMVAVLADKYPDFPGADETEKRQTMTRILLNTTQEEYEALPRTVVPSEEQLERFTDDPAGLEVEIQSQRKRLRAIMHFVGNMYIRRLLATKVVIQILQDLVMPPTGNPPEELELDCACDLLTSSGATLDADAKGNTCITMVIKRLQELQKEGSYSSRSGCMILDVVELRQNRWVMKAKREQAKTLREVNEGARKSKGAFEVVVAGARPRHMAAKPVKQVETVQLDKVIRLVEYYEDDNDEEALVKDWKTMRLSTSDTDVAVKHLVTKAASGSLAIVGALRCLVAAGVVAQAAALQVVAAKEAVLPDLVLDFPKAASTLEEIRAALAC